MEEIENSMADKCGDNHPQVELEAGDSGYEEKSHHGGFQEESLGGSPDRREQNIVSCDDDEHGRIEGAIAIQANELRQ